QRDVRLRVLREVGEHPLERLLRLGQLAYARVGQPALQQRRRGQLVLRILLGERRKRGGSFLRCFELVVAPAEAVLRGREGLWLRLFRGGDDRLQQLHRFVVLLVVVQELRQLRL